MPAGGSQTWRKQSQPLFDQGNGVEGTGHAAFVKSPDGTQDWIVYHARITNDVPRDVRIQPFSWGPTGLPVFGNPIATGEATPTPSGTPLVTFIPNLSFERGGTGWLDDFHTRGDAGSLPNNGSLFPTITGSDGPRIGYLAASPDSALYQDIGPTHAGTYTLSLGLALSSNELASATGAPATFLLRLLAVGLHPGGSADESDQTLLSHTTIHSSDLNSLSFNYFSTTATIPTGPLVGPWLRAELVSAHTNSAPFWSAKLDSMTLSFTPASPLAIPEPGALAGLAIAALFGRCQRGTPKSQILACLPRN